MLFVQSCILGTAEHVFAVASWFTCTNAAASIKIFKYQAKKVKMRHNREPLLKLQCKENKTVGVAMGSAKDGCLGAG